MFKRTSTPSRSTNTWDDLLIKGQYMTDDEFEKFIKSKLNILLINIRCIIEEY
jgi:hypothetical protein